MNVILDTNLLISSFLSKNTREQLEQIVISPHIQLLVCDDLLLVKLTPFILGKIKIWTRCGKLYNPTPIY